MSRNTELRNERNTNIIKDYSKLEAEVIDPKAKTPVQKYRHEAILAILSQKYYLTPGTVQNIVTGHA